MEKFVRTFYISTGSQSVYYTLRTSAIGFGDHYVCNLSTDEETAIEKAKAYVDAFRDRNGSENLEVIFSGIWDEPVGKRPGMNARQSGHVDTIESGIFPFGKYRGSLIAAAPESYLLYWSDKINDASLDIVASTLAAVCYGIALEEGYITKQKAAQAERLELDMKSEYVGTPGIRQVFEGEVFMTFYKTSDYGDSFWINKIRQGNDIIVYMGGKCLGEKGTTVKFKGTVFDHSEYKGVKSTRIKRPTLL